MGAGAWAGSDCAACGRAVLQSLLGGMLLHARHVRAFGARRAASIRRHACRADQTHPSNTPILPHSLQPCLPAVTLLLLGLSGFTNSLALFWLLLVLTLQRGPITPCDEELSPIKDSGVKAAAIAALLLPLLVLLPYPAAVSFTGGLPDLPPTF